MKALGIGTFIGILVQFLVELSYSMYKDVEQVINGEGPMSVLVDGYNHGSSSVGSDSSVVDTFWEDSEAMLSNLSTNAFSMFVLVSIKEREGVYDFGNVLFG